MTRVCVWILGDQLLHDHPALARAEELAPRDQMRVLLIESTARRAKLPYHQQKLVLLISAMRHYADHLRDQGYVVDYAKADTFMTGLRDHLQQHPADRLITMAASHHHGRALQADLGTALGMPVEVLPNTMFLVTQHDPYPQYAPNKRYVLENFYRAMRRNFRVLIDDTDQPLGGEWNFDKLNRQPLPQDNAPPPPLTFPPDAITRQVMDEIAAENRGVGSVDDFALAVTHEQAQAAFDDFIKHRFHDFGAYEDAMSAQHHIIYHSALSPYMNIGLLEPLPMIRRAESAYHNDEAPINSVEGFIRQILGWREYIYWQYWHLMPDLRHANGWNARRPMPQMFWDAQTDMNCIHHTVSRLIDTGYTHHIERLMIICNFCLLAGVDPAVVAYWFLTFYADAYEWVVLPNVIGMGLNADDGKTATKPYIASANYINKMSDYCQGCKFNHKARTGDDACPFNFLYWNFVIEHETTLRANPRMGNNVLGLRHLDDAERRRVQDQAHAFLNALVNYTIP